MTDDEITEKAQSIVDGKKFVKIDSKWNYKPKYELIYRTSIALVRQRDQCRVAMPHLTASPRECDEYRIALRIIKEVERLKNERST